MPTTLDDVTIVVISLDRRRDRYEAFMDHARLAGIPLNSNKIQKISAVDAKSFTMPPEKHPSISILTAHNIKNKVRRSHYEIDKAGAIGCSLSHFKAWDMCVRNGKPTMIFEDDAIIPPDFIVRANTMLADLPKSWDMVTFNNTTFSGGERACKPSNDTNSNSPWMTCQSLMGAQAYMLSPHGAKILLDHAYPIELHVDAYLAFMARLGYITMLWHPMVEVLQPFTDSDINHSAYGILNVPTNMENHNVVALDLMTLSGLVLMAGIAGGLLTLYFNKVHNR